MISQCPFDVDLAELLLLQCKDSLDELESNVEIAFFLF